MHTLFTSPDRQQQVLSAVEADHFNETADLVVRASQYGLATDALSEATVADLDAAASAADLDTYLSLADDAGDASAMLHIAGLAMERRAEAFGQTPPDADQIESLRKVAMGGLYLVRTLAQGYLPASQALLPAADAV